MNYLNKYNDFRVECIIALKEALKKGYNQEELWAELVENEDCDVSEYDKFPAELLRDDDGGYLYYIVKWDGESFLAYNDENMDYWFEIDDLETRTICNLIDLINEN